MHSRGSLRLAALLVVAAAALAAAACGEGASAQELEVTYYYLPG